MNTIKAALTCLLLAGALPVLATPATGFAELKFEDATEAPQQAASVPFLGGAVTFSPNNVFVLSSNMVSGYIDSPGNFYGTVGSTAFTANIGALLLTSNPSSPTRDPADSFRVFIPNGFTGLFSVDFAGQGSARIVALDKQFQAISGGGDSGTTSNGGCVTDYACNWDTLSFKLDDSVSVFAIDIFGADGLQFFDNLRFNNLLAAAAPPGTIPEPGGVALSLAAMGALAWTRKRMVKRS